MSNHLNKKVSGYSLVLNYLGIFLILIGIITLIPLITLLFIKNESQYIHLFLIPALGSMLLGTLISLKYKGKEKSRLEKSQDAMLITLIWIFAICIASIPFYLSGYYNFTQSIFESTSGFSTTGLTVGDVSKLPKILLFYRSFLQFVGGVGLVLVLTSVISDRFGMKLYHAEGHSDRLLPNLLKSARTILSIYIGYIIVGMIALISFGMPIFDALNHAMTAVATGGFSTKVDSIGFYNHLGIEIVIMILMLLGGTNFLIHLMLLRGKFKNVFKHIETKVMFVIMIIFIPMFVFNTYQLYDDSIGKALRYASFQMISAATGTGFQTIDSFTVMPSTFLLGLIVLMVLGASMGSTAGGIKQYRIGMAIKSFFWSYKTQNDSKKIMHPRFIYRAGQKVIVESQEILKNYAFIMLYITVLIVGTFIFTFEGHTIKSSLFEYASALGTVGLSLGIIGPDASKLVLWNTIIGMFLGRLEFYVVFIAIVKLLKDINPKKARIE